MAPSFSAERDAECDCIKVRYSDETIKETAATGLRCRFGSCEVPAWLEGDAISCCAPSEEVGGGIELCQNPE